MSIRSFIPVLVPVLMGYGLGGCAGYRLTPMATNEHDPKKEGYVFYAPAHYLLGTLKSPGNAAGARPDYEFKIISLPDHSKPYRFTRYEHLAKSNLKINFEDGWKFTGAESSTDSTTALTALVDLAKAGIAAAAAPGAPAAPPPAVLMYRIDLDGPVARLIPVPVPVRID